MVMHARLADIHRAAILRNAGLGIVNFRRGDIDRAAGYIKIAIVVLSETAVG